MMIVSNLLTWTGPCVCFDPAAELGPMVKRAREAMGRRVVILDPDHARVCGINGCGWIKPSSPMAEIDVAAQVEWVCGRTAKGDGGGNDSSVFFKNRGKAIVTAVLAHLIWDPALPPKLKTLNTMRQLLAVPEKDVKTLLGNIHQTSHSRLARQLAGSFSGTAAEDTFSGVCQSAEEDTRWLSVEAYGDLVSGDALQTSDLLRGDTDVFLSLPLKSMHDTPRVARVILGALLNELYDANGNIPNRVLFEIDEAWMLQQFEPLEIARPAGRKYGVTIQMWYQSVSQIEQQWGIRGAKAWFNDVSWYAFSGLNELQAAREVSEGIGEYGVVRRSESENTGKSGRGLQFGSRSRGRSVTYSEAARRVLQSAEILRDLRADALLVLPRSGKAALLGQCAHYRRDEWRDLVDDNRFAKLPGGKYARP
jgi:type IV secretion system protein VirD4